MSFGNKSCPACGQHVSKRKDECCPKCGTRIKTFSFNRKKYFMIYDHAETPRQMVEMLKNHLSKMGSTNIFVDAVYRRELGLSNQILWNVYEWFLLNKATPRYQDYYDEAHPQCHLALEIVRRFIAQKQLQGTKVGSLSWIKGNDIGRLLNACNEDFEAMQAQKRKSSLVQFSISNMPKASETKRDAKTISY